jgi:hypothetical protein
VKLELRATTNSQLMRDNAVMMFSTMPSALAVLHKVEQQIENLRADRDDLGIPGQLPPVRVERTISKQVLHFGAPSPRAYKI